MGGVAVLHPQDVLKDRLNYNRIPLISPLKPRDRKPNFIPNSNSNPKTVSNSNSNRRKRSPQKKNDVSRSPPSKSSNLGHNLTAGSGLLRSPPKGAQTLVMEKVKILKRGEALTNDEKVEKKMVFEKENKNEKIVPLEKNEKMVSEKNQVLEVSKINDDLEAMEVLKRLGPEPDMVLKQTRLADFYAGTGFVDSPDPRLVPVPFFFKKKDEEIELAQKKDGVNDDNGSIHLRRLLNLAF